jgi:hypothetical protein
MTQASPQKFSLEPSFTSGSIEKIIDILEATDPV